MIELKTQRITIQEKNSINEAQRILFKKQMDELKAENGKVAEETRRLTKTKMKEVTDNFTATLARLNECESKLRRVKTQSKDRDDHMRDRDSRDRDSRDDHTKDRDSRDDHTRDRGSRDSHTRPDSDRHKEFYYYVY